MRVWFFCLAIFFSACQHPPQGPVQKSKVEETSELKNCHPKSSAKKGADEEEKIPQKVFSLKSVRSRLDEFHSFIEKVLSKSKLPGLAIGVIEKGKPLFVKAYGLRKIGGEEKIDSDTLFGIGSLTKSMTTALISRLVEKKKVSWEQSLASLNPRFKLMNGKHSLSLQDAVCNCSGFMTRDLPLYMSYNDSYDERIFDLVRVLTPSASYQDKKFYYNNTLFAVAGLAVTQKEGKPSLSSYHSMMTQEVFAPLNMSRSTSDMSKAWASENFAVGHKISRGFYLPTEKKEMNWIEAISPAGSVFSSVNDMLQYALMELRNGKTPKGRFLSKNEVGRGRVSQAYFGEGFCYALGWGVSEKDGLKTITHNGGTFNYKSLLTLFPDQDSAVVILTNGQGGNPVLDLVSEKLLSIWFEKDDKELKEKLEVLSRPSTHHIDPSFIRPGDGVYSVAPTRTLSDRQRKALHKAVGTYSNSLGEFRIEQKRRQFFLKGKDNGFEIASSEENGTLQNLVTGESWALKLGGDSFTLEVPGEDVSYRFEKK